MDFESWILSLEPIDPLREGVQVILQPREKGRGGERGGEKEEKGREERKETEGESMKVSGEIRDRDREREWKLRNRKGRNGRMVTCRQCHMTEQGMWKSPSSVVLLPVR